MRILFLLLFALPALALERPPTVDRLEFKGIKIFYPHEYWPLLKSKPGLFRKPVFDNRVLDQDIQTLLSMYQAEGYQDAHITRREVTPHDKGKKVRILVELEQGPRTRVGPFALTGVRAVNRDSLLARLRLGPGKAFRQRSLAGDLRTLQIFYAERGHINASFGYQALQDSSHRVQLSYDVDEGVPVRVGHIRLSGLDKTRPYVVRRELHLAEGDLYAHSLVQQSQRRIWATGLFRTALVEPAPIDSTNLGTRDLIVTLRERRAGSLDLGLGYGTSERLRTGLALAQDNWMGRGLQYGLAGRLSRLLRKAEGAFTAPRLWQRPLSFDFRIFYEWDRNQTAGFTTQSTGSDITFSYQLGGGWQANLTYLLKWVELLETRAQIEQDLKSTSSLAAHLVRDTRNDLLDPSTGSFIQARVEQAGGLLQGASAFIRSTAVAAHYLSLGSFVLAGKIEARHIRGLTQDDEIFEYERFYMGGDRSVRGYERNQIGADRIGLVALGYQSEIRFPLWWDFGGVAFWDAGQVWQDTDRITADALRQGYGGGLRYNSPFGLVRLDMGLGQGQGNASSRLELYFGIGQGF